MKCRVLLAGVNLLSDAGPLGGEADSHFFGSPFSTVFRPVPIGLLYIAAAQRTFGQTDCDYRLFDFDVPEGEEFSLDRVFTDYEKALADFQPDIVALGCLTSRQTKYLQRAIQISRKYIDELKSYGHIIVGGKPATIEPGNFLNLGADVVCIGEGEITFAELVDCLNAKDDLGKVKGIMFVGPHGGFCRTQARPLVKDLDILPMPAWDLVDLKALHNTNGGVLSPFITSRGCPFECIFCDHNRKYRSHNPKRVVDEIEYLVKRHGFSGFDIMDEIFNLQKKRVLGIRDELEGRKLYVNLYGFYGLRADIVDEETIDAMFDMGMRAISIAIESTSPRLQKLIKKHLDIDRAKKTVALLNEKDCFVCAFYMVGLPTETLEEIENTLTFARDFDTHQALISKAQFIPGTELYELAVKSGLNPLTYRLENMDRFGIRNDSGVLAVSEKELERIVLDALFNVYNHVPRMKKICRLVSPIVFSDMYKKFYKEHNIWRDSFIKFFEKTTSSNPCDFNGLSLRAIQERDNMQHQDFNL